MALSGGSALEGGAGGASLGSNFGPWGALAGGVIGSIAGGVWGGPQTPQYDPLTTQLANLSFNEWQQASNAMYPTQSQLIKYAEDPQVVTNAQNQAVTDTNTSFNLADAAQKREQMNQGINLTPSQQAAISKSQALSQGLSTAANVNTATAQTYATQRGVLQGM